ncbi:MAG TPA: ABC transporter ATP-binding protein [Lacipirellulaceae bacterium]|nr:ABC transporter ATP-binding protein [Lacipirellulaceae bacterium]
MTPALVETRRLTKTYSNVAALDDCTLSIQPGEVFGLLGPNGSGKTTLLRLLMGFLRATRGSVTIAGRDCYRDSVAVHAGVSYLPGEVRLVRGTRAKDVLTFFARLRGEREPTRAIRIAERLGLDLSRRVGQMSTGMRQKLALATTLAVDVPLLILDEPTSNLDPTARGTVLALIREARAASRTVMFSSHVLSEIEDVCDRVVILRTGQVVHDQMMSQILRGHRIRAKLTAPLPATSPQFASQLVITQMAGNQVTIDAPGDLAPLLGYLATLPLSDMQIEPIGLQAVYERFHSAAPLPEAAA